MNSDQPHGSLKPENILFTDSFTPFVADYGIMKVMMSTNIGKSV
jgi:hypothetical protein